MDDRNCPVKADDLVDVVVEPRKSTGAAMHSRSPSRDDRVVFEARKVGNHVRGVTAFQERFEKQPVRFAIDRSRCLHIVG